MSHKVFIFLKITQLCSLFKSSLCGTVSKAFEKSSICKHMLKHLENHKIMTNLNHRFRSGYSCTTQLLVTTEDLLRSFDNNIQLDMAILDFSKASWDLTHSGISFMWHKNGSGANAVPCGTPESTLGII
jgi:hypothetical protein